MWDHKSADCTVTTLMIYIEVIDVFKISYIVQILMHVPKVKLQVMIGKFAVSGGRPKGTVSLTLSKKREIKEILRERFSSLSRPGERKNA